MLIKKHAYYYYIYILVTIFLYIYSPFDPVFYAFKNTLRRGPSISLESSVSPWPKVDYESLNITPKI